MTHPHKHLHGGHHGHHHYLVPFALIFLFAIIEAVGGWYTGSLALLSDAGHMFSDVAALGLAWLAAILAGKPKVARHASGVTYVELAVAIINALTMLVVISWVIIEAVARFKQAHAVEGLGLTLIASLGLIVNLVVAKQLHHQSLQHGESLNNRAAFLHVMSDLLGSIAAVVAGLVVYFTGWTPIDPILSLFISVLLLLFTFNLLRDIARTFCYVTLHAPYLAAMHPRLGGKLSTSMIIKQHQSLFQQSLAHFSDCEQYRYWLRRDWDASLPAIAFLMLNPSTADEVVNDPTIERCQRRAIAMGYGSMIIVNLFPYRLTDSTLLHAADNLLGDSQEADDCILRAVGLADVTVCGWGKHALAAPRAQHVLALLKAAGLQHKVMCLQLNKDGSPQHPLYIGYAKSPEPFAIP